MSSWRVHVGNLRLQDQLFKLLYFRT